MEQLTRVAGTACLGAQDCTPLYGFAAPAQVLLRCLHRHLQVCNHWYSTVIMPTTVGLEKKRQEFQASQS